MVTWRVTLVKSTVLIVELYFLAAYVLCIYTESKSYNNVHSLCSPDLFYIHTLLHNNRPYTLLSRPPAWPSWRDRWESAPTHPHRSTRRKRHQQSSLWHVYLGLTYIVAQEEQYPWKELGDGYSEFIVGQWHLRCNHTPLNTHMHTLICWYVCMSWNCVIQRKQLKEREETDTEI